MRPVKEGVRPTVDVALEATTAVDASLRRVGPFHVIGALGPTDLGILLVGFDPRLRRRVWLHELVAGTPPVAPLVRDLNRPGRLRWLNGRRTATDAWDADQALDGVSFIRLLDTPRPWRMVRPWLADFAREIDAGLKDGSLAGLTLDHLWITHEGRAKLLDFRVSGAPVVSAPTSPASAEWAQTFLQRGGHERPRSTAECKSSRSTSSLSAAAVRIGPAGHAGAPWLRHVVRGREPHDGLDERARPRRAMATSHVSRALRRRASVPRRDGCRSNCVYGALDDTCDHTGDRGPGSRP